ncbi:hypothetical protein PHAVU_003G096301 [Phaseolus vulgaris]
MGTPFFLSHNPSGKVLQLGRFGPNPRCLSCLTGVRWDALHFGVKTFPIHACIVAGCRKSPSTIFRLRPTRTAPMSHRGRLLPMASLFILQRRNLPIHRGFFLFLALFVIFPFLEKPRGI